MIARTVLHCVSEDGNQLAIEAWVGTPYDTRAGSWACPTGLRGLGPEQVDIHGVDSMQSLLLAIEFIKMRLTHFVEDGGKILCDEGGELTPLEALGLPLTSTPRSTDRSD